MKTEDFKQLKAICEKEGFEITGMDSADIWHITKKDPWDGVEFVECIGYKGTVGVIQNQFTNQKIYPVSKIYGVDSKRLEVKYDDSGRINGLALEYFKPSTEQAYVEQLKKEAFERFGEIKEGDRFDRTGLGRDDIPLIGVIGEWTSPKGFAYYKDEDYLSFNGSFIYRQGKWATRVKERVEVEYEMASTSGKNYLNLSYKVSRNIKGKEIAEIALFLSSQLEAYLNGEVK